MQETITNEDFIKKLYKVAIILAVAFATMTPLTATTALAGDNKPPIPPVEQEITIPNVSWNCCNG